jgi:hypothetical protein
MTAAAIDVLTSLGLMVVYFDPGTRSSSPSTRPCSWDRLVRVAADVGGRRLTTSAGGEP